MSSADTALINSTLFSMQGYASFHISLELITAFIMSVMASFIFWKYFDNSMGILTAYLLIYIGLAVFVQASHVFAVQYPPVEWLYNQLFVLFIPLILLVVFIFPNGQFVNNLSMSAFMITVLIAIVEPILTQNGIVVIGDDVGVFLFLGTLAIGIWSQIYRYRNISNAIEKQQTKWVVLGITSLVFCMIGWSLFVDTFPPSTPQNLFLTNTIGIAIIYLLAYLFPVSLMIAIMRNGLWGIDAIIRRTVQYALLTGLLALVFFGSVVLLQAIFGSVIGEQSPVVIVLSTLLIAALFTPLRRRVQEVIDRRFFRQKYDAQQVLAGFIRTARDETDLDSLTAELARVVGETMQPEQVNVRLKR